MTLGGSKAFFETQKSGIHEFAKALCEVNDEVGFSPKVDKGEVEMYLRMENGSVIPTRRRPCG